MEPSRPSPFSGGLRRLVFDADIDAGTFDGRRRPAAAASQAPIDRRSDRGRTPGVGRVTPTIKVLDAHEDRPRRRAAKIVCLILEGFACRYAMVPSGRRQILSLHIPGDIPDLQSLFIKVMDHNLATLVPTKVALIPHDAMRGLIDRNHRVAHLLWRDSLVDAAIFRKWIVGIGRRRAYARFAHLVCEFAMRMDAVGLMEGMCAPCRSPRPISRTRWDCRTSMSAACSAVCARKACSRGGRRPHDQELETAAEGRGI